MKTQAQSKLIAVVKSNDLVMIRAVHGVFALMSAALVAWPALAYIASRWFM
jgi:hypothetical protein